MQYSMNNKDFKNQWDMRFERLSKMAKAAQKTADTHVPGMMLFFPKEKHPVVYDPGTFEPRHSGPDEYFLVIEPRVPFKGIKCLQIRTGKLVYIADIQAEQMTIVNELPNDFVPAISLTESADG